MPVAVATRIAHAYHHCPDGQNTAACGHQFQSDPDVDAAGFDMELCVACLDLVNQPCERCSSAHP